MWDAVRLGFRSVAFSANARSISKGKCNSNSLLNQALNTETGGLLPVAKTLADTGCSAAAVVEGATTSGSTCACAHVCVC